MTRLRIDNIPDAIRPIAARLRRALPEHVQIFKPASSWTTWRTILRRIFTAALRQPILR
ncbi:hypothetical protein GKQ23_07675 [Erwinia sp. E602]|uniref:hypothetical protein n=1 Tax=Erwinia sp. E602 TaxID=2675378 RepID=UPI001BA4C128|nr:hypothetical protein [Erwinia sp. E602]QUG74876.1 hypothetical protein GKQ23_07675 [Erwinia sp. E602]